MSCVYSLMAILLEGLYPILENINMLLLDFIFDIYQPAIKAVHLQHLSQLLRTYLPELRIAEQLMTQLCALFPFCDHSSKHLGLLVTKGSQKAQPTLTPLRCDALIQPGGGIVTKLCEKYTNRSM